jgi:hypothetical protein
VQRLVVDDCPVAFLTESVSHIAFHNRVQDRPQGIWGLMDALNDTVMKA